MITGAKYNMLYPPLMERIYKEETHKGGRDAVKATKTRLHQMFGAYVQGNAHKKAAALLQELEAGGDAQAISRGIMGLHASTKERLPHLGDFLAFICKQVGKVETVLDLGGGFNPFSVPFWQECFYETSSEMVGRLDDCENALESGSALSQISKLMGESEDTHVGHSCTRSIAAYYAYDIDVRTRDLLNRFFAYLNLPQTAACADLAVETPTEKVDLALMCKLVPVLEAQLPGRGFELARETNAKFLAITYPLKSLGGREKGMGKNYAAQFENACASGLLGDYKLIANAEVGSELVYLLG